ncbi:MAG: spore germination protein [Clostridia bacterium]|nr:spore germination protein [Clostridia bacterium]
MHFWDRLFDALGFGNRPTPFELLETETGEPSFFSELKRARPSEKKENRETVPAGIAACEKLVRREFRCDINPDIILRRFILGGRVNALCVFVTGMVNERVVNDFVLHDAMHAVLPERTGDLLRFALENVFAVGDAVTEADWARVRESILCGKCAVFLDGVAQAAVLDVRGFEHRGVDVAQNEKAVRGPQEGFSENLRTNITLLRRLIRCEDFVCQLRDAGAQNNIKTAIAYREGVTNDTLLAEVKKRLASIDTNTVLSIETIEQLTERRKLSIFPQILATERPDRAAAYIMQGYVVVLLEGSPFANVMPTTLWALMSSAEDDYMRAPQGTLVRFIRFMGAFISLVLPGYLIAITLHHQGMLSSEALNTIIYSRRMVYSSIGAEMVFLLLVFQLIREAGLRVPGSIGQAIGIIGGLVLGQAAIAANMASAVLLTVVALSGLGNFCIPDYQMQISTSYLRLLFVGVAWLGGLLAMSAVLLMLIGYTATVKSYGVPFLAPFSPKTNAKGPLIRRGVIRQHRRATDYTNTIQGK